MLIVALVLAVIGLAALVTAVITSNELIAWVCIAASVIGVLLLIIDAVRGRSQQDDDDDDQLTAGAEPEVTYDEDYPEDAAVAEQHEVAPAEDAPAEGVYEESAGNDGPKS